MILTSQSKGSNSQKLEVLTRNDMVSQVSVDDSDCFKKGFTLKVIALVNVDDPFNQNDVHFLIDIGLIGEGVILKTSFLKIFMYSVLISTHILRIGVLDRHVVLYKRFG